jgi:DNA uptake protein ComE-like DNA-binding protein
MKGRIRVWIVAGMMALGGVLSAETPGLVDLNRASLAELMQVKGMTASWAGRIVRFRPYRTKLDLVQRGVVTAEVYARIRDGVVAHRVER